MSAPRIVATDHSVATGWDSTIEAGTDDSVSISTDPQGRLWLEVWESMPRDGEFSGEEGNARVVLPPEVVKALAAFLAKR